MGSEIVDVGLHRRLRDRDMDNPEYLAAYERATREIAQTDAVIRSLDALRIDLGMSKAELARRIGRNASSVRRLFASGSARPELPLIVAMADVLGAEIRVVPRTGRERKSITGLRQPQRAAIAAR